MFGWFGKKPAKEKTTVVAHSPATQKASGPGKQKITIADNNGGPKIDGDVDPEVLRRAAGAVQGKQATESIKGLLDDDDGRKAMANTLRKWMNDGRS